MTLKQAEYERQMNAVLSKEPAYVMKDRGIATWKKLGHLTDAKIRQLSTKYHAKAVPIDDSVEFKKWEADGKIYQGWVKKGTTTVHGVVRIIKKNLWFEEVQFLDGKAHGFFRLIWHDGRYEEGWFKGGIRHGPEFAYDKGKLKYIQHYHHGETGKRECQEARIPEPEGISRSKLVFHTGHYDHVPAGYKLAREATVRKFHSEINAKLS